MARVGNRVATGGHHVPEVKIRTRYARLWQHVSDAITVAHEAAVYDNSRARHPYRVLARYEHARLTGPADWPRWAPEMLRTRDS